jgi:hypothetical protein
VPAPTARERSQAAGDDPDGTRAALFLQELTGEFLVSYTRCLQEATWEGPQRWSAWAPPRHPSEGFRVAPDALYIPTRLTSVDGSGFRAGWSDLLTRHAHVLVLGAGGTGKTILADRICYEIAAGRGGGLMPYDIGFVVPLRLRVGHGQDLETLITDAVRSRYRLDLPQEMLITLLAGRPTVVIFDGFDELSAGARRQTVQDIDHFCAAYPSAKVIVTSRPGPPRTPDSG